MRAGVHVMSFLKAAVALAGTMIVFVVAAQSQNATAQPTFDAASLKIAVATFNPRVPSIEGGPGTNDPGRVTLTQLPLMFLWLRLGISASQTVSSALRGSWTPENCTPSPRQCRQKPRSSSFS